MEDIQELRSIILQEIESYDIDYLKRIAYEHICEEHNITPDGTYIRWQ